MIIILAAGRAPADVVQEHQDVSELVYARAKDAGLEACVEKEMEPVLEPHIEGRRSAAWLRKADPARPPLACRLPMPNRSKVRAAF